MCVRAAPAPAEIAGRQFILKAARSICVQTTRENRAAFRGLSDFNRSSTSGAGHRNAIKIAPYVVRIEDTASDQSAESAGRHCDDRDSNCFCDIDRELLRKLIIPARLGVIVLRVAVGARAFFGCHTIPLSR